MSNIVETFEDMIQNAFSTAMDNIIKPRIQSSVRSITVSSGLYASSITASSERWEQVRITASFESASGRDITFHKLNMTDETREYSLVR